MNADPNWTEVVLAVTGVVQTIAILWALIYAGRQFKSDRTARKEQAEEASAALEASMRPYVTAHLEARDWGSIQLTIENTGRTPARSVAFAVDPPLMGSVTEPGIVAPLNEGVPMVAPGQRITCEFDWAFGRDESLPRRWELEVTYVGPTGQRYVEPQTLDLEHIWGTVTVHRKGTHQLVEQIEQLRVAVEHFTSPSGGVRTVSPAEERFEVARAQEERKKLRQGQGSRPQEPDAGTSPA